MAAKSLKNLPEFVSLRKMQLITGRSPQYILERMPPRLTLHARLTGWRKATVIRYLRKHPEMILPEMEA